MPEYKPPARDMAFVVNEVLAFEQLRETLGFDDATPDTVEAIFDEAGKLARDVCHPLYHSGDAQGCRLEDGEVIMPDGFADAYRQYVESGWGSLAVPVEHGGQGMPHAVATLVSELFTGANHAWYMYPSLTHGAVGAILTWGSDEQKQRFLPKLVSCEWSGTMNLTESHAGTDLGMLRTRAEPQADGSYRISGEKIFISAGEHSMSENIIHLVLARLPDAPEGTRGITMFLVPKFLINEDGSLGERNGVRCTALEHKMGINGSATCVLNYDNAEGYLIGEENGGLKAMFTMMNSARLGVGVEGLGKAELAYQYAVDYAKNRLQGKSVSGRKLPEKPADPIIHHPDVRRMLLSIRSFTEGARALAAWTALQEDISAHHPDAAEREKAEDYVGLMTPVVKAFFTDEGFTSANHAIQVYGGHGYIGEHGVEQIARDARISQLYEGTNGIQAMDLVGRKLALHGGRAIRHWLTEIGGLLKEHGQDAELAPYLAPLSAAFDSLQKATGWLMQHAAANPENAGSAATSYLRLMAIVAVGAMWLRIVVTARRALADGAADAAFYESKLVVARFFFEQYGAEHGTLLARVEAGCESTMALPAEAF